jgi:hypothetical protein
MQRTILVSIITLLAFQSCTNREQKKDNSIAEFNQKLSNELIQMAELDQTAAGIQKGKFKEYSLDQWGAYKDSVFSTNKKRAEEIFNQHGFPGYDLVGEKASYDFWLVVQHCDFDTDFQKSVLADMKSNMENENASKKNYAYLIDRVNKNLGQKIIYGTQVRYDEYGQAISQPLEDSVHVNLRRAEVGLEPLEVYLNIMTTSHFEMNKENMLQRGITEPKLHPVPIN